jgi:TonB family protein
LPNVQKIISVRAMRLLVFLVLLTLAAMPRAIQAADAEGCADLKLFPRLEGCVIVECSAKHHDPFDAGDGGGAPVDADINALSYSCTLADTQKLAHDFDAQLRKTGYQNIVQDKSEVSTILTARKGSQWVRWSGSSEDGVAAYVLSTANGSREKFKAEACGQSQVPSPLKQCEVVDCASKLEDSVGMRTSLKAETSLTGNVQTLTLACPTMNAAQAFSTVEGELRTSGFEILFSDREHPESAWVTGRAGKRWVELASARDGESVSYALTMVPSAEVLTEPKPEPAPVSRATAEPAPVAAPTPAPAPEPKPASAPKPEPAPVETAATPVIPSAPEPPVSPVAPAAAAPANVQFIPPKVILQVPIEPTHDRIYSVVGDVVINMLVDVDEDGRVANAVLTGHITKDVLRLESAALEAVKHWRFEPALQDGRIVPAVKIGVQMHFRGRPWRF